MLSPKSKSNQKVIIFDYYMAINNVYSRNLSTLSSIFSLSCSR